MRGTAGNEQASFSEIMDHPYLVNRFFTSRLLKNPHVTQVLPDVSLGLHLWQKSSSPQKHDSL